MCGGKVRLYFLSLAVMIQHYIKDNAYGQDLVSVYREAC